MIANFLVMGALYQHREYDTLATEWNTYPWLFGEDNPIEQTIQIEDYYSDRMIWGVDEEELSLSLSITNFAMAATLIRIDNFGNFGKAVDNPIIPSPLPSEWLRTAGPASAIFKNIQIVPTLINQDSNSENLSDSARTAGPSNVEFKNVVSQLTLINQDSNSENLSDSARTAGPSNAVFKNISSELV